MSRTPKYIFAGDFRDLESYFAACPHKDVSFRKGDYLWEPGEPFDRIHYIRSGVVQNYLVHETGHRKIISFHAGGTIFPGFHYLHYQIEESLLSTAMTHVQAYEYTQDQFAAMFAENFTLVRHVIDWFSSYTNLLIYDSGIQEYNSSFVRLCNLLYLLKLSDTGRQNLLHELTQEELADTLGVSLMNVSRGLTELRHRGIIETKRKAITILDADGLMALCSGETLAPPTTTV